MKVKKITACLLASVMVLSTALTSYASGAGSSAGQGNVGNTGSTNDKGNGTWSVTANTGFRLTIVDGSGNPVSKILGVDNAVSLDVFNGGIKKAGEFWTACATAPNQGKDAYVTTWRTMSQFLSYINEESHGSLYWMTTDYQPLGDQIREFILKGASSTSSGGGSGDLGELGDQVSSADKSENIELTKTYLARLDRELHNANGADTVAEAKEVADRVSSLRAPFASALKAAYPNDGGAQWKIIGDWLDRVNPIIQVLSRNFPNEFSADRNEAYVGGSFFGYRWEEFPLVWEAHNKQQANKVAFNVNPLDWFSMTAYAAPSEAPSTGGIDEEGKTAVLTDKSVLEKIINMNIDGVYVFQLEGSAKTKADAEAGKGLRPAQLFIEKGYNLLLESTIQGQPQEYGGDWTNYKSLVYGTSHNWSKFLQTSGWKRVYGGDSAGNHVKYVNQYLPNSLITLTDWITLSGQVVLRAPTHGGKYPNSELATKFKTGYGCHLYTGMDLLGSMGAMLDSGDPPESNGESFVLNRFFREKKKDGTYTYSSFDTHSYALTESAVPVLINSVASGAALVEWGTSESEKFVPDTTKSPSEYSWETVKAKNTGVEQGTATKTLSLDKSTKIQTINILYELSSSTQVIKVYEDEDGNTEKVTPPTPVTGAEYTVPDEDEYVYVESKVTPNPPKTVTTWEDSEGSGGSSDKITITEDIKTIYIKYVKQDATTKALELYSNELSYTYDLRDLLKDRKVLSVYDSVPASPGTRPSCSGHTRRTGTPPNDSEEDYECSERIHRLADGVWSVKVDSGYDYNSGSTFIRDAKQIGDIGKRWITNPSGDTNDFQRATPNLRFMLYRDSGKDKVTLYPEKNAALKGTLSGLGIEAESYTPSGSRIARVGAKDKSFRQTFETHFDYTEHDTSLSWLWPRAKCDKNNGGTYNTSVVVSPEDINSAYSQSGNTREWYLLGTENSGSEKPRDTDDANWINQYRYNHSYSQQSTELSFYPYHKMLYRAHDDNKNPQAVYITSENLSKMQVFNTIQTGVYKKSRVNANLDSTQWSTHARSLAFLNSLQFDKRSVLPGGGILNLDMGQQGDTVLGVRLWQTALPDSQVQAVQTGFNTSVSKAKELVTLYQSEVEATLAGYGLVQWGTEEITTESEAVLNSGEELHGNQSSSLVTGNSGKTSSDEKYYLKQDGSGSNRANLDVLESRVDRQVVYTVLSDVDGNIWVERDGALIGSKSKVLAEVLANSEVKLLDDNTKVVSNLFNALDRNLGEYGKYTRTQGTYYNEAFDGVSVVLTDLSFDLGFSTGGSKRSMVLDPLLLSTAESKSELYDFEEGKVRTSAFVTTEESTSGAGGKGCLGTLGGDSNMGALSSGLGDVQSLVNSRVFFWSNFSVSDLN